MKAGMPVVSIIVPVYNDASSLPLALSSIQRQTYRPIEVIVVDDGSTDASGEVARTTLAEMDSFPSRYLFQPNQGPAAARNAGLAAANGDLVAFLDSDDEWLPARLEQQVEAAIRNPEAGCILCRLRAVLDPGEAWPAARNRAHFDQEPAAYLPSALLARRSVFDRIVGFDANLPVAEDLDWFFRLRDAGLAMVVVPDVLVLYRVRSASLSQQTRPGNPELFRVLHASLRRRREPASRG